MKNKTIHLLSLIFLVIFVFNPFGTNIFELPKIHFLSITLSIIVIFLSIFFLKKGKITVNYNKIVFVLLGLWLLSLILSTIFSIAPELSFWGSYDRVQGLYSHIIYLTFLLIFNNFLKNEKSQTVFLKIFVIAATITAIHAILQKFGIGVFFEGSMDEFLGRSFTTFGHPNFLGQFLIFPIWVSIYFLIKSKKKDKIFPLISTLLLIIALLCTENRASILGIIIGGIVFVLASIRIKTIYKYILSGGLLACFASFLIFIAPSLRSITARLYLWDGSLQIFPEHPLFGSGLETFKLVFQKIASAELFTLEKLYSIADRAHNEYLDILVMQGLFGFIVYISIILGIFYLVYKQRKKITKNKLLLTSVCAFISILISNFFGFQLTVNYLSLTLLIAIILNQTIKFQKIKIKKNLVNAFIAGILVGFSLLIIFNSTKTIYADNKFLVGTKDIYKNNITEGVNEITEAASLNTHQSDIYFQLSDILFLLGKETNDKEILKQADEIIEYAGEFTNYDFRYYFSKARINAYLGDYELAEELFMKASELAPVNPIIMKEWGAMYYLKGDYPKTIDKMEQFLNLIPEYWKWKNSLDELEFEDQEKFRLFTKHVPDLWDVFSYLARSYAEIGNVDKAGYYLEFIEDKETIEKINNIINEKSS